MPADTGCIEEGANAAPRFVNVNRGRNQDDTNRRFIMKRGMKNRTFREIMESEVVVMTEEQMTEAKFDSNSGFVMKARTIRVTKSVINKLNRHFNGGRYIE